MKKIDAIIRPHLFEDTVSRLRLVGVTGLTVTEVHGISTSTAATAVYRGHRYQTPSAPRVQLTIVVRDDLAAAVVNVFSRTARTEEPGDGIVMIAEVLSVLRIRTGESGADAL
jgi:nitrogen regulatory protein PII